MLRPAILVFLYLMALTLNAARAPHHVISPLPARSLPVVRSMAEFQARMSITKPDRPPFPLVIQWHNEVDAEYLNFSLGQESDPLDNQVKAMEDAYRDQTASLRSLFDEMNVRQSGHLAPEDLMQLPVGIRSEIAGKGYTVGILKAEFTPEGASLTIVVEVELPDTSRHLYFGASGIPFSGSGGLSSGVRIGLIGDYPFKIGASQVVLILRGMSGSGTAGPEGSFVRVDCDGFIGMHLQGDLLFHGDRIIPVDASGNAMSGRLQTRFELDAASLDDIYVGVSLPPFKLQGVDDFYFDVSEVKLDFSDQISPEMKALPADYQSPFRQEDGQLDPLWHGVSIGQIGIHALPGLTGREGSTGLDVVASQVLVDEQGFSGTVAVNNLLSIEEGNLDGWAFSIDQLEIAFVANQLIRFGFNGLVHVPIFKSQHSDSLSIKEPDCFAYSAVATTEGNYQFSVKTTSGLAIPMWNAQCHIAPNSTLLIEKFASRFLAEATLHGDFSLGNRPDQPEAEGGVTFQNLVVRNVRPYIQVGSVQCGLNSGFSIEGFAVVLDTLGLKSVDGDRVALIVGGGVSLTSEIDGDKQGIGGYGGFTLFGKIRESDGRQLWTGDGMKVNDICIDLELKKFRLNGCLSFYEENVRFGKGFYGVVNATLDLGTGNSSGFSVVTQFGSLADYKYYLVDVMVKLGKGIPLGVLALQGIGGGLSNHMSRTDPESGTFAFSEDGSQQVSLGASLSGVVYEPDPTAGLAFRFNAILALSQTPKIVNGIVGLAMAFNAGGGIRSLTLNGAGGMLTEVKNSQADYRDALVNARIDLIFDFQQPSFTGALDIDIHTDGLQAGGRIDCNFSPDDWFIWVGTPQAPLSARLIGIGAEAYLDAGSRIPPPATLPPHLARLTQVNDFSQYASVLSGGRGLAFGFQIGSAGDTSKVGPLRIALAAQLGADLMMREMTGVQCAGREGPVGINNWYALGQVYAFLGGSLVFDDYLFKKHVTFTIAQLAAAMVLQGHGPDPTYFQGILAGSYNLLNGLVKGRFRARLTIGDDCQFVEETNTEEKLNLIIAVNPDPAANTEVPNDINPEVEFMFPVGQIFMLPNTNGDNDYYRFEVLQAQLGSSEGAVAGVSPYANGRNTLRFVPDALLEPFTTYLFSVRVEVKERRGGSWQTLLENGQPVIIDTVVTFTTGAADSILLRSNISAAYPVPGQQNFHVDEFSQGYLQLEKWQPDLLDNRDIEVVMEQDGQTFLEKVILDHDRKTIAFNLPDLQTGVVTRLQLKDRGNSRELFAFEFRTSNYRTFSEKMATTQRISRQKEGAQFGTDHYLTDEFPDEIDFGQLWKLEVALDDPWYRQFTKPILYTQYPNDYFNAQHEDPDIGFPPVEAVRIQENKNDNTFVITNGFYQMVEQDFYLFKTMVVDYLSEFLRSIDRTDVIDREGGIRPGAQEQFKELLPEDKRYILDLYSATYLAPAIPSPGYLIHYTLPGQGWQGKRITSTFTSKNGNQ